MPSNIETERLILRPWQKEDLEPFARLNADPRVMEYFPSVLSRGESDQLAKKIQAKIEKNGWGFWAVSLKENATFIGFLGLNDIDPSFPFAPAVEIGWRLAFDAWGKGYATEGAKAVLQYGFETVNLNEIVSFTAVQNQRSRRIMEKIGMHHDPQDNFDHPKIPEGHPLRRHVLYRLNRIEWEKGIEDDKSIHSSGIIPLCKKNGQWNVFLVQYQGYEHYWGCPKGHLLPNETHKEAAIRELQEETGLQIKLFLKEDPLLEEFYWVKNGERLLKRVLFFVAEVEGKICLQKEEIIDGQWLTLPAAIEKVVHAEGKTTLKKVEQFLDG